MVDVLRTCRRTGCRWPASASLSFRYATRQVWLLGLAEQSDPAVYDVCPDHADALTVPRGWEIVDDRPAASPRPEPAGRDLPGVGEPAPAAGNGYAALSAALPRLAAEFAARRDQGPA